MGTLQPRISRKGSNGKHQHLQSHLKINLKLHLSNQSRERQMAHSIRTIFSSKLGVMFHFHKSKNKLETTFSRQRRFKLIVT